jgi:hypothetical protein
VRACRNRGLEVGNKAPISRTPLVFVLNAQQRRGMNRDDEPRAIRHIDGLPRTLPMVTVRPVRLRAAVTPSATMVDGLTRLRSKSSQTLQRSIS